ncbi:hypothetical protein D9Q98_001206 [Chlorella vulgaris]|uniref:Uncharacterized protein n=2 Tax=Chlorella vulgaris TaxID=3077 RepID=A0A9D4Z2F3_CHLVU|nr:hypothetical protein D9Q98_001206 [Chlorella vulgaris]
MGLFRSCSPTRPPSFVLGLPDGDHKVTVRIHESQLQLRSKGTGEVIEMHPLQTVSWHTCVLPSKQHALCLRIPAAATHCSNAEAGPCQAARELLLRCKTKHQAEEMQAMLCAASLALRQMQSDQDAMQERPSRPAEKQQGEGAEQCSTDAGDTAAAAQQPEHTAALQLCLSVAPPQRLSPLPSRQQQQGAEPCCKEPSLPDWSSFGSPVPEAADVSPGHSSAPTGSASPKPLAAIAAMLAPRSAPSSPVLPGLALVLNAATVPPDRPSASAPASPAHSRKAHGRASTASSVQAIHRAVTPPVRLLSSSGRPCSSTAHGQVQQLRAEVARLSAELAQSRMPDTVQGSMLQVTGGCSERPLEAEAGYGTSSNAVLAAPVPQQAAVAPGGEAGTSAYSAGSTANEQLGLALQENCLLLQQQASLQAELGRMQGQLSAAAGDNIRLAQEAVAAVRQLQAMAEAASSSQLRERQLHSSLAAAVGQCGAVGRELVSLSAKLEARAGQYQELKATADTLSGERTELTAALATVQVQLNSATPAGWAAEAASLRRQADSAQGEAAAARAAAVAVEARLAGAQRREAEAAGHLREAAQCMEAAQTARASGLARERQLAGEVQLLRQQLAGKLPDSDPAKALQERLSQLEAAQAQLLQERATLLVQVQQLSAVGQELSSSCRMLEAGRQAVVREREGALEALSKAQAGHAAAELSWEKQRQQLEASLGAANGRLANTDSSAQSSKAEVQALAGRMEALLQEHAENKQRAAGREQELMSEIKQLTAKHEAEVTAARARKEAEAATAAEATARHQEQLRIAESNLAAARRQVEVLEAEQQRVQEDARRASDGHAAEKRDLQLQASSAQAEAAKLEQDLKAAQGQEHDLRRELADNKHMAQQAQAQAAAAAGAQSSLSHERKQLQARLERLGVERARAARDRDAAQFKCATLQQQCNLLEAVAQRQAADTVRRGMASSKENASREGRRLIKSHRPLRAVYGSSSD